MRKYRRFKGLRRLGTKFRRHRHKIGSMKGLTSVPVRFRGRRL